MLRQVRRLLEEMLSPVRHPYPIALLLTFSVALLVCHVSGTPALCEQTKADCQRCCEKKDLDEYYMEQCKVKCFRNPDHCTGGGETVRQAPRDKETAPRPRPSPTPKPGPARSAFHWPNPLNLTPGNEWEAAAQILSMNGITPQHPNASPALQAVEAILKEFVRTHPQGGSLPTAEVRRVIKQFR